MKQEYSILHGNSFSYPFHKKNRRHREFLQLTLGSVVAALSALVILVY